MYFQLREQNNKKRQFCVMDVFSCLPGTPRTGHVYVASTIHCPKKL